MGPLAVGDVVLVVLSFSDLSAAKLRPAVVAATAEFGDVILCQITSRPYRSRRILPIENSHFISGGLDRPSVARYDKLITASPALAQRVVGRLTPQHTAALRQSIAALFG